MLPYQDEWRRIDPADQRASVRFVTDHVASMTDTYAYHVHAEMYGTSAGAGWE
jgi:dGTP triphosphohydrolase